MGLCLFALAGAAATAAAAPPDPEGLDPANKHMTAIRVDVAPVLDGRIDEEVWERAIPITDFRQREPQEGAPASERTEVRLLYDDRNLYVAFILGDREPDRIIATQLRRDDRMRTDDTMAILLDTYHDHRNGFLFRVNPLGTRYDATLTNQNQINSEWDEVWHAAARITDEGWVAELAIPFRILRYPKGSHTWGVDFKREIRRRNEEADWSNFSQDFQFNAIHLAGHLEGLSEMRLRERFRFKPFATGTRTALDMQEVPFSESGGDLGVEDFKVQITPNLTGDLTVNTDFAQVEADATRVNLTRFSLFFPEQREFFLEGANNFTFGTERNLGGGDPPLVLLYHSRRVGLAEGDPVPIGYGGKITGKLGSGSIGLLNTQTRDSEFGDGQNFSVARWRQDLLERSYVGAILTNVQDGNRFNRVGGLDANFKLFEYLEVSGFAAAAFDSDVEGERWSGQLRARWSTDSWEASADTVVVDDEFDSDVGFILRQDIIRQSYSAGWKPRPDWGAVRQVYAFGGLTYITDRSGRIVERTPWIYTNLRLESGDSINVEASRGFERLDFGFEIYPGIIVPAGDYTATRGSVGFRAYEGRRVGGAVGMNFGEFYGGTRLGLQAGAQIRFNERLSVDPSYGYNQVDLPDGSFVTHVARLRLRYSFSNRVLTDGLLQYNSVNGIGSIFARLRYIYRPGDDFFLVFRQSRAYEGEFNGARDRSLTAKATYSFNF
jgi:hypothetical protein